MQFKITLQSNQSTYPILAINYQYGLSSALYRIIAKGDSVYAQFLHETGYGKGFKFFTFSQISSPFIIKGDRLHLQSNELSFVVSFHLPQAMESFIKGLFQSEKIDIADKKSKASFVVKSIETLPNPFLGLKENEILSKQLRLLSPVVVGIPNEKGNYDFLSPDDARFVESLIYNWRNKVTTSYDDATAQSALLLAEIATLKNPYKSRLIHIKSDSTEHTKIRGWMNFELKLTAEKRFVELLFNAGAGLYNAMGMGALGAIE